MQTATIMETQAPVMPPLVKSVRVIPAKPELTVVEGKPKIQRAAAYCRVSTDKDEQEKSYQAQCDYYTDKIMSNPEMRMAGIYAEAYIRLRTSLCIGGLIGYNPDKPPENADILNTLAA